jgi:hypothetical protein
VARRPAWIPSPTDALADVFGNLIRKYHLAGNLVRDAHMAALSIEHGLEVCSAYTDFARLSEIRWLNPLAAPRPWHYELDDESFAGTNRWHTPRRR